MILTTTLASDLVQATIEDLSSKAAQLVVRDSKTLNEASGIVKAAKAILSDIENARKCYTKKLDKEKKSIIAQENTLTKPLTDAIERLRVQSDAYLTKEHKQMANAKSLAAKKAKEAQEAMERVNEIKQSITVREIAGFKITEDERNLLARETAILDEAINAASSVLTTNDSHENVSSRVVWDYEITAEEYLPRSMLSADREKIKAILKQWKNEGRSIESILVDGLRIFEKITTIFR